MGQIVEISDHPLKGGAKRKVEEGSLQIMRDKSLIVLGQQVKYFEDNNGEYGAPINSPAFRPELFTFAVRNDNMVDPKTGVIVEQSQKDGKPEFDQDGKPVYPKKVIGEYDHIVGLKPSDLGLQPDSTLGELFDAVLTFYTQ